MKTLLIALFSTLVMFSGANAQIERNKDEVKFIILFGKCPGGKILLHEAKAQRDLKLLVRHLKDERKEVKEKHPMVGIWEFKITLINVDGKEFTVCNKGPWFNPQVLDLLKRALPGDKLVIHDIVLASKGKKIPLKLRLVYELVK